MGAFRVVESPRGRTSHEETFPWLRVWHEPRTSRADANRQNQESHHPNGWYILLGEKPLWVAEQLVSEVAMKLRSLLTWTWQAPAFCGWKGLGGSSWKKGMLIEYWLSANDSVLAFACVTGASFSVDFHVPFDENHECFEHDESQRWSAGRQSATAGENLPPGKTVECILLTDYCGRKHLLENKVAHEEDRRR